MIDSRGTRARRLVKLARFAKAAWIFDVCLIAAGIVVLTANVMAGTMAADALLGGLIGGVLGVLWATPGALIVTRGRGNAIGWLMLVIGSGLALLTLLNPTVEALRHAGSALAGVRPYVAWVADW